MGILNVTPDSFSDGGRYTDADKAIAHGLALVAEGAHIVDVGGESTRPGAGSVDPGTEMRRVVPVVRELASQGVIVSIDTMKPQVARAAIDVGAEVVNDIGGLVKPEMLRVVIETGVGVVIMHMKGTPRTMQQNPSYRDVVGEVKEFLEQQSRMAMEAGVARDSIVVDPGIGFGKTSQHNLTLLAHLEEFHQLGLPIMLGTSRKSFLGQITGVGEPDRRDLSTAVTVALAAERGVQIVRVHDVAGAREAALVAAAIVQAGKA